MQRYSHWAGFLALALVVPAFAADKDARNAEPAQKEDKDKLISLGQIVCKVARVEGSQKYITVQISQTIVVPTGGIGRYARPSFRLQQLTKDIDLQAYDDIKIRVMNPPVEFDDKGKPRKRTQKELQELKGPDPKLPGYAADFDSLRPDQIVKVSVATTKAAKDRARAAKPALVAKNTKKKEKEEGEAEKEAPEPERPLATMIVILVDPAR